MNSEQFVNKFLDWVQKNPPCLVDGKAYNEFSDLVKEALTIKHSLKPKKKHKKISRYL